MAHSHAPIGRRIRDERRRPRKSADVSFSREPQLKPPSSPSQFAELLGHQFVESKHKTALAPLGQFFTPRPVAKFMANSFLESAPQKVVRILDPGAGAGVLSCALIERIAEWAHKPREIELVAYEIDPQLEPILRESFQYLEHWLSTYNIVLSVTINASDFLAERQECFGSTSGETEEGFDFVIANPPYSKTSRANASTRKVSSAPVSAQPNVYASFMAVATSMLLPGGQLTFITPEALPRDSTLRRFESNFLSRLRHCRSTFFLTRQGIQKK